MSVLDGTVRIGRQQCIVIQDYVAAERPNIDRVLALQNAEEDHAAIWFSEEVLENQRSELGDFPAYGMWQLLLFNKAVDLTVDRLWGIELGGEHWLYLRVQGGMADSSGLAVGNSIPQLIGYSRADAEFIEVDETLLGSFRLPQAQAFLPSDVAKREKKEKARRTVITISACVLVLGAAAVTNWLMGVRYDAKLQEISALKRQKNDLNSKKIAIENTISPVTPAVSAKQRLFLQRMVELIQHTESISTTKAIGVFEQPEAQGVTARGLIFNLSFPVTLDLSRNGILSLSFSITPGQEITIQPANDQIKQVTSGAKQ